MKIRQGLVALVLGAGVVVSAQAAESPWYVGITGGAMLFKESMGVGGGALASPEAATNIGVMGGYLWSVGRVGSLAVEGDFTDTAVRGNYSVQGVDGTVAVQTLALYGVYRSPGTFYVKAKAGVLNEKLSIARAHASVVNASDIRAAVGFGGGFNFGVNPGGSSFEVEYTFIEENVSFVSASYRF